MLEINNLHFSYSTPLFKKFTHSFAAGERTAIVGASGVGKTTLLKLISGELKTPMDTLSLNGKEISSIPLGQRPLSIMFQEDTLFSHLNVMENIIFPLKTKFHKKRFKGIDHREAALSLLVKVGLSGYETKKVDELSGGQRQRVALARTLILQPQLLLLDEPFSALDESIKFELNTLVSSLVKETKTVCLQITHDLKEALTYSEKILFLENGSSFFFSPQELQDSSLPKEICKFFSCALMEDEYFIPISKLTCEKQDLEFNLICLYSNNLGSYYESMLEYRGNRFKFYHGEKFDTEVKLYAKISSKRYYTTIF